MIGNEEPLTGDAPQAVRGGKRTWLVAGALILVLLLAIFLPPLINLGRYRRSITSGISAALGRPVSVGDMQLRLLPTPGISITNLTVDEDPAFGYEPALHANSVVVSLRLSSLWRRRLEVGRISLDEASLNLVRNSAGQWSVASVLQRASELPNAATGQRYPGATLRFPYIEATNSRINFKEGVEKRPFSLMNAEFAMWQASGSQWRLRLKAQPVRTDLQLHLSDTGVLTVEGSLERATNVHAMPVNLQAAWSGAQLGQVSRLLFGADSGWRGDLDTTTTITGTTGDFALKGGIRVGNLRRQEFQPANSVNVDARCEGRYRHPLRLLDGITCFLPEGSGHLLLTGSLQGGQTAAADLVLEVNQVPAQLPLNLLALVRPHAANVSSTGTINGHFEYKRGAQPALSGDATVSGATLSWPGGTLPLPALHASTMASSPPQLRHHRKPAPTEPQPSAVTLAPVAMSLGAPAPLLADARVTRAGFSLHLSGSASVARLMSAGANFGLLQNALSLAAPRGVAVLDTSTSGNWMSPLAGGSTGIATTGTIRITDAELRASFLHAPVAIASAQVNLSPQSIDWQNVDLRYAGMPMRGSIQFPAQCPAPPCPATFSLQPGELSAAKLETALAGRSSGFFGQVLAELGAGSAPSWPPLSGTIHTPQLTLGRLALHNVVSALTVKGGTVSIDSLDASTLGGTVHAGGVVAVSAGTPHWTLDVNWTGLKPAEAATLFGERWGSGTANGAATLALTGYRTADLASSAHGTFRFVWQNGGLGAPAANPLARFSRFAGDGTIGNATVTLANGSVISGGRAVKVEGSAGFDRRLNLTLDTRAGTTLVGGTLARPTVQH